VNSVPSILIATSNSGKAREFQELLPFDANVVTLRDLELQPPDETGSSFVENATLKALAGCNASGLITIADDSGICVDALGGSPGIHSARYAGIGATDAENRRLLLQRLQDVDLADRAAHFEAAIVVAHNNTVVATGIGRTFGSIGAYERGDHGFGYDSVFVLPDGRTMAELPSSMKNEISHRSKALQQVIPALARLIDEQSGRSAG
jgi:XTP/dITP diphosphohydrolase